MNNSSFDQSDIPRLSSNDIEAHAESIIELFSPKVLEQPCQTPLISFVGEINRRFGVEVDLERDLGITIQGKKILGMYCFRPKKLFVDKSLNGDVRFSFVFAHELGHFVFHRDLTVKKKDYSEVDISDSARDFATGRKILLTPRDWLEWQANRFASAVLMPRKTFFDALMSVQKSLGITRNLGRIYLEQIPYSLNDFHKTLQGLGVIYHVGKKNVEYRLNDLGLIIDSRDKNTKHISEFLAKE